MLSLAARLRPRLISDVVGQEFVCKVLQSGLKKGNLSSVCLFSGPAGTGKTTLARAVSMELICEKKGKTACLQCAGCKALFSNTHPDVLEFDAATHTGVEDIKQCLESANYKPQMADCKIFIIDEAHMLSKSAISALLKIIEEPDEGVWFFLATTELEKIPYTIISRCLTLNLKKITDEVMKEYLAKVCDQLNYTYEVVGLDFIVQASNGCVRAALSMLEQLLLLNDKKMMMEDVRAVSSMIKKDEVEALLQAVLDNTVEKIVGLTEEYVRRGNPYKIGLQLLDLAKEKHAMDIALQLGYALEELAYSPCPDKVLSVLLVKAAYLHTLPNSQLLWKTLKEMKVVNSSAEGEVRQEVDQLYAKAKQLFK